MSHNFVAILSLAILCVVAFEIDSADASFFRGRFLEMEEMKEVTIDKPETLTIVQTLQSMYGEQNHMILLQWNESGILTRWTPTVEFHRDWFVRMTLPYMRQTKPSEYGTVAFLFNSDSIIFAPTDKVPPVPLLVYSIVNDAIGKDGITVIPNPYDAGGYNMYLVSTVLEANGASENSIEKYLGRQNVLVWRGSFHGEKQREILVAMSEAEDEKNARDGTPTWLDAKESSGPDKNAISPETLAAQYRYHLDLGGVSGTAWSGLRWKMCSGNLVFKVDTFAIDWWHVDIEPYKHYIPVKEDLSDLREQYEWAESNMEQAYEIARRGQLACLDTVKPETAGGKLADIVQSLPPATYEQVQQAKDLFDNHLSDFYPEE